MDGDGELIAPQRFHGFFSQIFLKILTPKDFSLNRHSARAMLWLHHGQQCLL
jgi:hypothetical protein